jgi:hypothetical protein
MAAAEVRLLLAEKQLHLDDVCKRCERGEDLAVNAVLKRFLERNVGEISRAAARQDRGLAARTASPAGLAGRGRTRQRGLPS